MKEKLYLRTWFICLMFILFPLIIPPILGLIFFIIKSHKDKRIKEEYEELQIKLVEANEKFSKLDKLYAEIGGNRYEEVTELVEKKNNEVKVLEESINNLIKESENNKNVLDLLLLEIDRLRQEEEKYTKQVNSQVKKLSKIKSLYKSVQYSVNTFHERNEYAPIDDEENLLLEDLAPSVMLKLHCMDVKDLRRLYKENEKNIEGILSLYSSRYSTKANRAIYQLMVIALKAELQNILYSLKFDKLETAVENVKKVTEKYVKVAEAGNQNIAGTLGRFIGEIEDLFINAVKIEYNYYVKKEQARQEQVALREQMRQEAEERKALEEEKKKIEKEEGKYRGEISNIESILQNVTDVEEMEKLKLRILELQNQLDGVKAKKDEIISLQNGKAGTVYIISNLGSFGDEVFKIGMTRRLDPQDRVNELGDASVPFKFDVHSFIFSDDAVSLESKMHLILNNKRLNKVNLRKEFFHITLDELEQLVNDIEPTAEFNRTMLAEEYRQSLSAGEIYSHTYESDYEDEE